MKWKNVFIITVLTGWVITNTISAMAENEEVTPVKVTEKIFMIAGAGGNVGFITGEDGTFLIDDNFAPLTEKIIAAVKSVGGDNPKFLINTHYHGDHTGGNENFGRGGTLIFSHDNVRERLKNGYYIEPFKMKAPATAPEGLPVVTFSDGIKFHLNGDTIHAIHVAHAHTDGDSFIYFAKANVIHAGDILFNGFYPFIDVSHGGTLRGTIAAVDEILSLVDKDTKIIPGHGPLAAQTDLQKYRDMLSTAYDRLRKLKASGKTAQEAAAANPLEDLEKTWGNGMFTGARWIELIYPGV